MRPLRAEAIPSNFATILTSQSGRFHGWVIGGNPGPQISCVAGVSGDHPWYVADKDLARNRLVVVDSDKHPYLLAKGLTVGDVHWIAGQAPKKAFKAWIQARYRQKTQPATVRMLASGKEVAVALNKPIQAAAIGQSAVIYRGQECLGGGVIRSIEHSC